MGAVKATAQRVDTLLAQLSALGNAEARRLGADAVRALLELYGEGLARMLDIVHGEAPALVDRLAADPLVSALLVVHDLHPFDTEARIGMALDRVRPMLASHGGNVRLVALNGSTVHLALEGTCHGCPSSSVTMKLAVEEAIRELAPEVDAIEVVGSGPVGEGVFPERCLK